MGVNLKTLGSKTLAAFDVDGTLTWTDSFMLFLRYYSGRTKFFLNLIRLVPTFVLYGLKLIGRDTAKNHLLTVFFAGDDFENYRTKAQEFAKKVYPIIYRKDGLSAVSGHKNIGDEVALVSASLADYLEFWAVDLGVKHVLATRLEVVGGKLTGKMAGPNCRAEIKLQEIRKHFPDYELVAAYGDSRGDKEMLEAAKTPFYRKLVSEPRFAKKARNDLYFGNLMETT